MSENCGGKITSRSVMLISGRVGRQELYVMALITVMHANLKEWFLIVPVIGTVMPVL